MKIDKTGLQEITLQETHGIMLDIMKDIDRFCRANDIPYTISAGTLLGAVRHGGFIPWDDDADLFMLREDFDRFIETYKSDRYHLLFNTRKADEFFAFGYAKIVDPTTVIEAGMMTRTTHGVFVDIFPLDHVPEDPKECRKYMHSVLSTHNRIYHRQRTDIVSILKSYRHSLDWWVNRLNTLVHTDRYKDSPLVAQMVGTDNYRTVVPKEWFETLTEIPFEGYPFLGFKDTDAYLTMLYGPDYMTPKKWSHDMKVYRKPMPHE